MGSKSNLIDNFKSITFVYHPHNANPKCSIILCQICQDCVRLPIDTRPEDSISGDDDGDKENLDESSGRDGSSTDVTDSDDNESMLSAYL